VVFRTRDVKQVREKKHEGFSILENEIDSSSSNAKAERRDKCVCYPEELDPDIWRSFRASITCQALGPGETPMRSLGTRDGSSRLRLNRRSRFSEFDIDSLVTQEFHHLSSMEAPLPISPKYWRRSQWR
jgi:hypothetical protein